MCVCVCVCVCRGQETRKDPVRGERGRKGGRQRERLARDRKEKGKLRVEVPEESQGQEELDLPHAKTSVRAGSPSPTSGQTKQNDMVGRWVEGQELPCPDMDKGWWCWNDSKPPSGLAGIDGMAVQIFATPQCPAGVGLHLASTGRGSLETSFHGEELTS